ncbi:MAG: hypothetical protein IMY71_03705 [Bacteroidetes bacterium]|nr:hypothetical protein [Bacteroidota bacterium]
MSSNYALVRTNIVIIERTTPVQLMKDNFSLKRIVIAVEEIMQRSG